MVHYGATSVRWVHSGSRGFTLARQGVVGFIRVRLGSFRRAYVLLDSFGFALVHIGEPRSLRVHSLTQALIAVVGFIRVLVGSLARILKFACVDTDAPRGRLVHSASRGFTREFRRVIVFIRVHVSLLWRA